jgi:poly(A) polymerase
MTRDKTGDAQRELPRLADAPWLAAPAAQAVFRALARGGHEARVVGGAVRNALLGEPVKDVDISTPALPEEVMALAEKAGLKAVPTGIEHGTVTVISAHVPYEVTTLRRDIETFGRHARVTFSTDWAEDARRRDFTINALYCSADGQVHDPLGGFADIAARRVRFIGNPHDRIREDYLRILRFFRFTAEYSGGAADAVGLAASSELASGLDSLSRERIRAELLRLLAAPGAAAMARLMDEAGILARLVGPDYDLERLTRLIAIEAGLGLAPQPILRLAALAAARPGAALVLRDRLRLSAAEYERIARAAMPDPAHDPATPEIEAKTFLYRHGAEAFSDGVLLSWAGSAAPSGEAARRHRLELPLRWAVPLLPVRGADVMSLGVPAGPEVGRVVARFEEWWLANDFTLDPERITAELQRLALVTKA